MCYYIDVIAVSDYENIWSMDILYIVRTGFETGHVKVIYQT